MVLLLVIVLLTASYCEKSVFHLDFAKALAEISRLTRDQVIIFQGNDSFIRKAGQSLFGHREFNEQCRNYYLRQLEYGGFKIEDLQYRDTLAFALSGGFIGYQLLPQSEVSVFIDDEV